MWQKIKDFFRKKWKWLLGLFIGTALAVTVPQVADREGVNPQVPNIIDNQITISIESDSVPILEKPLTQSKEIISKRTENSKTFDNQNNTYSYLGIIGIVHYKENLSDEMEEWKDIDPLYKQDMGEYWLFDKSAIIVKVFKNKIGYEVISRYTQQSMIVELNDEVPKKDDISFEIEIQSDRVRLWKELKTEEAPLKLRWKITNENKQDGLYSLKFRELQEAYHLFETITIGNEGDQIIIPRPISITTKKIPINENSFYWEEEYPEINIKVDTDILLQTGASADDVGESKTSPHPCDLTTVSVNFDGTRDHDWGGHRWQNVTIAEDSTINAASVQVYETASVSDDPDLNIYVENYDSCSVFTTANACVSSRTKVSGATLWKQNSIPYWEDSPDIATKVQSVINRGGWSSGNSLCVDFEYISDISNLNWYHWDQAGNVSGPKISINYTPPAAAERRIMITE